MVWDMQINPVVRALSQAINDQAIIRDIAVKSGRSMEYVRNTLTPRATGRPYWSVRRMKALCVSTQFSTEFWRVRTVRWRMTQLRLTGNRVQYSELPTRSG